MSDFIPRSPVDPGPMPEDSAHPDAVLRWELAHLVLRAEMVDGKISPATIRRLLLGEAIR